MHTVPASETMSLLCALLTAEALLQVGYDCKIVGDTWQVRHMPLGQPHR